MEIDMRGTTIGAIAKWPNNKTEGEINMDYIFEF